MATTFSAMSVANVPSGRMVPSARTLMQAYEVSDSTVKHALAQRRVEGLVVTYAGKGSHKVCATGLGQWMASISACRSCMRLSTCADGRISGFGGCRMASALRASQPGSR